MKKELYELLGYISQASVYGIKLDILAHLFFGTLIYAISKRYISTRKSLAVVACFALIKEVHDTQVMTNSLNENIKDFIITMIIPLGHITLQKVLIKLRNFTNK